MMCTEVLAKYMSKYETQHQGGVNLRYGGVNLRYDTLWLHKHTTCASGMMTQHIWAMDLQNTSGLKI